MSYWGIFHTCLETCKKTNQAFSERQDKFIPLKMCVFFKDLFKYITIRCIKAAKNISDCYFRLYPLSNQIKKPATKYFK